MERKNIINICPSFSEITNISSWRAKSALWNVVSLGIPNLIRVCPTQQVSRCSILKSVHRRIQHILSKIAKGSVGLWRTFIACLSRRSCTNLAAGNIASRQHFQQNAWCPTELFESQNLVDNRFWHTYNSQIDGILLLESCEMFCRDSQCAYLREITKIFR